MVATPALSVVVLNYNYGHYLPGCLTAILEQSFTDFEVIVIDDLSTDDSVQILQPFLQDPRVRLVAHQKNLGFAGSLIQGTEEFSRGEFYTVISADDLARRSDAFATQMAMLRAHPEAAFCFSAVERFRTSSPEESAIHNSFPGETVLGSHDAIHVLLGKEGIWPSHSGTILRASAYKKSGGYRRDTTMPLDLAIWLALAPRGGFAYTPVPLYGYRLHDGQMSASPEKIRRNTREIVTILRDACEEGEKLGFGTRALFRSAVNIYLGTESIVDAFDGNRRSALRRCAAALTACPIDALASRKLWVAAARATLGEGAYRFGRTTLRRLVPSSHSGV